MLGRAREMNPRIPAHIEQEKLPVGVYFDHRWSGGTWYQLYVADGKRRRRNIANAKATLADLHRIVDELKGDTSRGSLDWLCGEFEASKTFEHLAATSKVSYRYCRRVIQTLPTKLGVPFGKWQVSGITNPVMQRLVDKIAETYPTKANTLLRYLRRLFKWGVNRGHCATNPGRGVEAAKERKRRRLPDTVTMVKVIAFMQERGERNSHVPGACAPYLWMALELAYLCRLRGIEVVTLTDQNATKEGVMTNRRKGSRDNVVRWTPRLRAVWDAALAHREATWKAHRTPVPLTAAARPLLVSTEGHALRKGTLDASWHRAVHLAIAAGVITKEERFGMHDLKRKGITDTPGTRGEKQLASGHRTESQLDVYDHSVPLVSPSGD